MNDTSQHSEKGTRLHKYSPIFILINVVLRSIIPLVFGVFTYGHSKYANTLIIASALFIIFFAILQYWFYLYWIKDEKIEIKEGILFKQNRKVPYTRIQNVNVSQNPLQRILKVATLQLESASGGKPEAVMRVVDLDVVEMIKQKVRFANSSVKTVSDTAQTQSSANTDVPLVTAVTGAHAEIDTKKPLHQLTIMEVVKYGVISQKGMFYGAIIFSFLAQNQLFVAGVVKYLNIFYPIPDFTKITLSQGIVYVAVVGSVMFVFLQLMSILWSLMKFYDFKIVRQGDRLQAQMGLLSKVAATIPLKKIQLYRISENPLHKYFKSRSITIETAGGVNTNNSGIVMRWLAPYIHRDKVKDFMYEVEPKIKLGDVNWQLIPQRAWKRVLKRSLILLALIAGIIFIIGNLPKVEIKFYAWIIIALMVPVAYLYSKNYVKKTAYFINNDIICFKSGVWFGKQSFVKISKIQTVEIIESPFDRRNNMATLDIDTAGSNPMLHHVRIPYLEIADAFKLQAFIQKRLDETEFDW